jgi:hypothetical protein
VRALIDVLGAAFGALVGASLDALGTGTPAVIGASVATAIAVILVMRRMVGSMTDAGRETIDGLRHENDRLRAQLAERER